MVTTTEWATHWGLDPAIRHLNHGSFGACPLPVLAYQQQLRVRLEQDPVCFFGRTFEPLVNAARDQLAAFVGATPETIAFVPNATTGVNTILKSLSWAKDGAWQPGDELLTTDHEYNACRNALNAVSDQTGLQIVVAAVPFPISHPDQVLAALLAKVTAKTRLVLIDHVTSQTGLIMPIAELAAALADRGIELLVDGAHAPGMIPLNLAQLGVDYYTGNCHKWLCAPKGAAFLYVKADRQAKIRPLTISHGANSPRRDQSRFQLEFDWTGTHDPTAYLAVPEAIRFMGSLLPGGWEALRQHNHAMALAARDILCQGLAVPPPAPDAMIGAMAVLPLPPGDALGLYNALYDRYHCQVPVFQWFDPPQRFLRISMQLYTTLDQVHDLLTALQAVMPEFS